MSSRTLYPCRVLRIAAVILTIGLVSLSAHAQSLSPTTTSSSAQLTPSGMISAAVSGLGGLPSDSVATGRVTLITGTRKREGTFSVKTLGSSASEDSVTVDSETTRIVFANDDAARIAPSGEKTRSMELAATAQSPFALAALLAGIVNDRRTRYAFVGDEMLDGRQTHHLRTSKEYTEKFLAHLTSFSRRDVWIDSITNLPLRISFDRRVAAGAEAAVRIDFFFSDYRGVAGRSWPFMIRKFTNGSLSAEFTVETVTFDNGLSAADFSTN